MAAVAFDLGTAPSEWPGWFKRLVRDDARGTRGGWTGGWQLGEGGQGMACLWAQFDQNNRLSDVSWGALLEAFDQA